MITCSVAWPFFDNIQRLNTFSLILFYTRAFWTRFICPMFGCKKNMLTKKYKPHDLYKFSIKIPAFYHYFSSILSQHPGTHFKSSGKQRVSSEWWGTNSYLTPLHGRRLNYFDHRGLDDSAGHKSVVLLHCFVLIFYTIFILLNSL